MFCSVLALLLLKPLFFTVFWNISLVEAVFHNVLETVGRSCHVSRSFHDKIDMQRTLLHGRTTALGHTPAPHDAMRRLGLLAYPRGLTARRGLSFLGDVVEHFINQPNLRIIARSASNILLTD